MTLFYDFIRHNPRITDFANRLLYSRALLSNPLYQLLHDRKMRAQMERGYRVPPLLTIETTNVCNARCNNCPNSDLGRPKGHISGEVLEKTLSDATAMGIPRVNICGHGEPLLVRDVFDRLASFQKYSFRYLTVTTNGSILTTNLFETMRKAGVHTVNISVDSGIPELYEELRVGLSFDTVKENIRRCREWKDVHGGPAINIQATLFEPERNTKSALVEQFGGIADSIHVWRPHNWAGSLADESPENPLRMPCPQIWCAPAVYWNGDVPICCFDHAGKAMQGNVMERSFSDIWQGTSFNRCRALHTSREFERLEPCRGCSVYPNWWVNFGGGDG